MMMGIRKFSLIVVLTACLSILWMATAFAAGADWEGNTITAIGSGVAPPRAVNPAQARMLARRAAVVDAYRQLAETVQGVNVDSETTVENMMTTSDVIKTKVSAMIKGARVVSEQEIPGGYTVTMQISMFGVGNSLAGAVLTPPPAQESFPTPVADVVPSVPTGSPAADAPSAPPRPDSPRDTPPRRPQTRG